ncbi:MAG: Cu(I)/Ag(I) efflux system periplasmic protein CusF [Burkholderiales bacterium]
MKTIAILSMALVLSASGVALAQSGHMKGMDNKAPGATQSGAVHQTTGVVKAVDPAKGKVTLAHEPVPSLKWPKMTMGFAVNDKSLFDRLAVGKKVDVEFVQQGSDYVVTTVK